MKTLFSHLIKTISICLLFINALVTFAQEIPTYVAMSEIKYKDNELYKKHYPTIRKVNNEIFSVRNREAFVAESGKVLSLTWIDGDNELGKYVAFRQENIAKIRKAIPAIISELEENTLVPNKRSTWVIKRNMSHTEQGFKTSDYAFRRVNYYSVPVNKINDFEAAVEKLTKLETENGIIYNKVYFKCVEGYPGNTYALFLPEKSRAEAYKAMENRTAARKALRQKNEELYKLVEGYRTILDFDHLERIPY